VVLLPESQRLLALEAYAVLDTPPEGAFDELTSLARTLCDVPIALVSLVDRDRQWFKSCIGLDVRETPRAVAFCARAIEHAGALIVPDALKDPLFAENPLVTGPPHVRFYAGFPLIDDAGAALGTLCVIDRRPRHLDDAQLAALRVLAAQVVAQLRVRRLLASVEAAHQRTSFLYEASKLLGMSLQSEDTLQALASLVVPAFADACSIVLCGPEGTLRRVGESAIDESTVDELRALREVTAEDTLFAMRAALASGRPVLYRDYAEWLATRGGPEHPYRALIERLGITSVMSAPILVAGVAQGVLNVAVMRRTRRHFDQQDLVTFEELAHRAALALENARLFGEAQRADRAKDMLLAAVSHDLRTPLSAIQGWSQLMRHNPDDPALRARAIVVIERSVRSQLRLVEDLVDASRIVSGKLHVERTPVDLAAVIEACLDSMRPLVDSREVVLRVTIQPGLDMVLGDADRISQIVWNLVSNAVKFSSKGGEVHVELRSDDDHAELVVRDQGCGIEASFLPYVFERFRQDDAGVGRRRGGLGLGLAIAKHLVEAHEGTIQASSEGPGSGAVFRVRIPFRSTALLAAT